MSHIIEGRTIAYQTDGLYESEAQNGVGEELATEGRVAGDGSQEGREHKAYVC